MGLSLHTFGWFERGHAWKLLDISNWAATGQSTELALHDLRYCPPEVQP